MSDMKPRYEGQIEVQFDMATFGAFLRRVFPHDIPPIRTDGTACMTCGEFVTWKAGTCPNGHDL